MFDAVHAPGSSSWQISEDAPIALLTALFLRDVAAPRGGADLPPCEPPPARHLDPDPDGDAVLSDQWDVWWAELLDRPGAESSWRQLPDLGALAARPELRSAVARHSRDAATWASDRHREHGRGPRSDLGDVVRRASSETTEQVRSFTLRIDCLPLQGSRLWAVSPGHVLVTFGLCRDRVALHRRLLPAVEALV